MKISYKNDIVFKHLLTGDDKNTQKFISFLLKAITHQYYQSFTSLNTVVYGQSLHIKASYFDLKLMNEKGGLHNFEMQDGPIDEWQENRFQYYAHKATVAQIHAGQDYSELKTVDEIVLTTTYYGNKLLTVTRNGLTSPLVTYYVISLPYVNKVVNNEKIEDLEAICYLIENGNVEKIKDKLNERQKEIIEIMERKYYAFIEDNPEITEEELLEYQREAELSHMRFIARKELEQERNEIKEEGMREGLKEGKRDKAKEMVVKMYKQGIDLATIVLCAQEAEETICHWLNLITD